MVSISSRVVSLICSRTAALVRTLISSLIVSAENTRQRPLLGLAVLLGGGSLAVLVDSWTYRMAVRAVIRAHRRDRSTCCRCCGLSRSGRASGFLGGALQSSRRARAKPSRPATGVGQHD